MEILWKTEQKYLPKRMFTFRTMVHGTFPWRVKRKTGENDRSVRKNRKLSNTFWVTEEQLNGTRNNFS